MNVIDMIKKFDKEYDYLPKDGYRGVFRWADLLMEYYTQERNLEITCEDDVIDARFACYAYKKIHDPKTVQEFCFGNDLVEYSSILHKYLGGRNELEVEALITRWKLTSLNKQDEILYS